MTKLNAKLVCGKNLKKNFNGIVLSKRDKAVTVCNDIKECGKTSVRNNIKRRDRGIRGIVKCG